MAIALTAGCALGGAFLTGLSNSQWLVSGSMAGVLGGGVLLLGAGFAVDTALSASASTVVSRNANILVSAWLSDENWGSNYNHTTQQTANRQAIENSLKNHKQSKGAQRVLSLYPEILKDAPISERHPAARRARCKKAFQMLFVPTNHSEPLRSDLKPAFYQLYDQLIARGSEKAEVPTPPVRNNVPHDIRDISIFQRMHALYDLCADQLRDFDEVASAVDKKLGPGEFGKEVFAMLECLTPSSINASSKICIPVSEDHFSKMVDPSHHFWNIGS